MWGAPVRRKKPTKRIEPADDEVARGRRLQGEKEGQPEIDVLQQAKRAVEARRHLERLHQHEFLNRAQRAHAAAESAPKEHGHDQRQEEGSRHATGTEY